MIRVILVDDEANALNALKAKLHMCERGVDIIGMYTSPVEAYEAILEMKPDIVFLDVEMPEITGLGLAAKLKDFPGKIIFTTAHKEYAIQAYKTNAMDYLLKPIDIDELSDSLKRYEEKHKPNTTDQVLGAMKDLLLKAGSPVEKIALPTLEGLLFVNPGEIIYLEAEDNYTKFFLDDGQKIVVSKTIREFEEILEKHNFLRVHHSFIVNLKKVSRYIKGSTGTVVMDNGSNIPVSVRKKQQFLNLFQK
jgi:two-component system, LytTR family, response regulator